MTVAADSHDRHPAKEIPDLVATSARLLPDRVCVTDGAKRLTFSEVSTRADRLVSNLRSRGVARGDRVALLAKNQTEYLEIQVGCQRHGCILVPLNFRLTVPELQYIIDDSQSKLLIAGPEFIEQAVSLEGIDTWLLTDEHYLSDLEAAPPAESRPISGDATFALQYTSGTTGFPKGAMISNRAHWARVVAYSQEMRVETDSVFLQPLPLFHIATIMTHAVAYCGGRNILVKEFDAQTIFGLMERERVTHLLAVPTMLQMLCDAADTKELPNLQRLFYGAAPAAPSLLRRAMNLWPEAAFAQFYGATEAGMVTMLRPEDHDLAAVERLSSAGKQATGCWTEILDDVGHPVGPGAVGEIVARGPSVMDGYWNNDDATREAIRGGWLHMGDLGYFDAEGYVHVVDRKNDMIVSGGENVYPTEVENVIYSLGGVQEVAVVGVPHPTWGEQVQAAVNVQSGAYLSEDLIRAHCRELLAGYKVPKRIHIMDELPKNATGKILRRSVRDELSRQDMDSM